MFVSRPLQSLGSGRDPKIISTGSDKLINMDIKPLTASMAKPESAEPVFFFERGDGSAFHVDERTAWGLYARPQQTIKGPRQKFKYIGMTNGQAYRDAVLASSAIFQAEGLEAAQNHLRKAWEAELELAKTNTTPPRNFDRVDNSGSPAGSSRLI